MHYGDFLVLGQVNDLSKEEESVHAANSLYLPSQDYLQGNFHILFMTKLVDFYLLIALNFFRRIIWEGCHLTVYLLKILYKAFGFRRWTALFHLFLILVIPLCIITYTLCQGNKFVSCIAEAENTSFISFMFPSILNKILVTWWKHLEFCD